MFICMSVGHYVIIREILERYFEEKMIVLGPKFSQFIYTFIAWNVKNHMMLKIERFLKTDIFEIVSTVYVLNN